MNPTVILSFLSVVIFIFAFVRVLSRARRVQLAKDAMIPLLLSLFLYLLIVMSNFLEHLNITRFLDPFEDMLELIFPLVFLFFVHNWRKQKHIQTIQDQQTWLRSTLESIADGVLTTDRDGNILHMNQRMETMTGYKNSEAAGRTADDLLCFGDKSTGQTVNYKPFQNILTDQNPPLYPGGILLISRLGQSIPIADTLSRIMGPDQKVLGAVGLFRDMSRYESLTEQLTHTHKMEAIGQLAGGVAHDLNNMLGGIMGAADVIHSRISDQSDPKNEKLIAIIRNSAESARDLTANLLAFSRRGKIMSSPVSITEVVDKTIALAERAIDKQIGLEKEFPDHDFIIIGDFSQLQNALLNLVLNSRDAMPGGGTIYIQASQKTMDAKQCRATGFDIAPGPYVTVTVRDTGNGIAEENLGKLFEPFFTTKKEGQGTGLGLSAVYGTMVTHNGAIQVDSTAGEGSAFHLMFPFADVPLQKPKREKKSRSENRKGTVLLIDDEEMLRISTQLMLEDIGFTVLTADGGENGIREYRKHRRDIDMVLLDMMMPGMNGTEVFAALLKIDPRVRVIFASGYTRRETIPEEAAGFLNKPYTRDELTEEINKVFNT